MMIDSVVFTRLTPRSVADIVAQLKTGGAAAVSRPRPRLPMMASATSIPW